MAFSVRNLFSMSTRERCMTNMNRFPVPLPNRVPSTEAAVLIPLCDVNNTAALLYTVRAGNLRSHSGLVSFPGGKTYPGETSIQTALRETQKETGLMRSRVDVWGHGPAVPGCNNSIMVTPVVGAVSLLKREDLCLNFNDVSEVFTVPLQALCDTQNQYYTRYQNGFNMPVFVAGEHRIWGLTALLTHVFLCSLLNRDLFWNDWMRRKIDLNI